jgi:hypothetical protein
MQAQCGFDSACSPIFRDFVINAHGYNRAAETFFDLPI